MTDLIVAHATQPEQASSAAPAEVSHADILDAAYQDGRQSVIDQAHEQVRQALAVTRPPQSTVEVLRPQQAPEPRAFTGAPRRVSLTGGRMSENGGFHRDQSLFR